MSLERIFGALDAQSVAALLAGSSEIALLLDSDGVILDVSVTNDELAAELENSASWLGRSMSACVTIDSRARLDTLFKQAALTGISRRVHLNHPGRAGASLPVLYTIVRIDEVGTAVALGRDLRIVSTLQQRLVDAQQSLDRDYIRLRHLETRYRLLFEMTSEAVVILDARSFRVMESNGPARTLLSLVAEQPHGNSFHELFDAASADAVQAHLVLVRMAGRGDEISGKLAAHGLDVTFAAWLIREEDSNMLLVRMHETQRTSPREALSQAQAARLTALDKAPDGFVLTAESGRILSVNPTFLDMVQLLAEEQAVGASLDQWLGRAGVDLNVLIANLRQRGSVRLFATTLRSQFGAFTDVEISAVGISVHGDTQFAMTIRDVGRRLPAERGMLQEQPKSVEQLTELIGRVPLKDLVRESTDMIERLSIEAALNLTKDNRASAAELLGLSRQSLYVKLRRYGLGELDEPE